MRISDLAKRSNLNARASIGLAILIGYAVIGFVLPHFAPRDPTVWRSVRANLPPSFSHLLGTTSLGQDVFWLLTWSIGSSLALSILVSAASTFIGLAVGLLAGFRGGWLDRTLSLTTDTLIVIPILPLLLLLAAVTQGKVGAFVLGVTLIVFNWPYPARQIRAVALSLREREFVHIAAISGEPLWRILAFQLAPYLFSWLLANLTNTVLVVLVTESSLAVIGLASPENSTLGTMIYFALEYQAVLARHWWWIGTPIVAIVLLFVGLFLTSSGLTEGSAARRGRA